MIMINRLVFPLVLGVLLCSCASLVSSPSDREEHRVIHLEKGKCGVKGDEIAKGFFINKDGWFLTSGHFLNDDKGMCYKAYLSGSKRYSFDITQKYLSRKLDYTIAKIETDSNDGSAVSDTEFDYFDVQTIRDKIFHRTKVGVVKLEATEPDGLPNLLRKGEMSMEDKCDLAMGRDEYQCTISRKKIYEDLKLAEFTLATGDSGSPILVSFENERVVGMFSGVGGNDVFVPIDAIINDWVKACAKNQGADYCNEIFHVVEDAYDYPKCKFRPIVRHVDDSRVAIEGDLYTYKPSSFIGEGKYVGVACQERKITAPLEVLLGILAAAAVTCSVTDECESPPAETGTLNLVVPLVE